MKLLERIHAWIWGECYRGHFEAWLAKRDNEIRKDERESCARLLDEQGRRWAIHGYQDAARLSVPYSAAHRAYSPYGSSLEMSRL